MKLISTVSSDVSDGLDHDEAIRGLNARPLEPVVKGRVLVLREVHTRSMPHNPYADVADISVSQQTVAVDNGARQHRSQAGKGGIQW